MKILSLKDDKINSEVELFEYPEELRGGRNLIGYSFLKNNADISYTTGIELVSGSTTISTSFIKVIPNQVYTFIRPIKSGNVGTRYYDENKIFIGMVNLGNRDTYSFTTPSDTYYFKFIDEANTLEEGYILVKGNKLLSDYSPAPEDLNLSYPDFITEFKPSISDRYILTEELIEYPEELSGGRNLLIGSTDAWKTVNAYNSSPYTGVFFKDTKLEAGQTYVFSWETELLSGSPTGDTQVTVGAGVTSYLRDILWTGRRIIGKQYRVFTPTENHLALGNSFMMRWFTNNEVFSFRYRKLKLEKGNKPSADWTETPEDLGLTYPDHIQSFGTSFGNNILINEFIEQ